MQPMHSGTELFAGAKKEGAFGHMILCGLGGIYIEVLKDVQAGLAPISEENALEMIKNLNSYKIIEGVRGQDPINATQFAEIICQEPFVDEVFDFFFFWVNGRGSGFITVHRFAVFIQNLVMVFFFHGLVHVHGVRICRGFE